MKISCAAFLLPVFLIAAFSGSALWAAEEFVPASPADKAEKLKFEALEQFWPTPEEAAMLDAAPATISAVDQHGGLFTNPDGISGYFSAYGPPIDFADYSRPFNFIWQGKVKDFKTSDGQTYKIMNGRGRLLVKHMGDDILLEKYEGGMADGIYHGKGKHWMRNDGSDAATAFYDGEYRKGVMEGRGLFTSYDFYTYTSNPTTYKGDFKRGAFHGQGEAKDLVTGELFKGWWVYGNPIPEEEGGRKLWKEMDKDYERMFDQR